MSQLIGQTRKSQQNCLIGDNNTDKKHLQRKQVVYNNRVLHVNKKFIVPIQKSHFSGSKNPQGNRSPRKKQFKDYIELVIKNQVICRRGAFQGPVQSFLPGSSRAGRVKTQSSQKNPSFILKNDNKRVNTRSIVSERVGLTKFSYTSLRKMQEEKKKELPVLKLRRRQDQDPIKVDRYVSKSSTRVSQLDWEQKRRQVKNLILRRLNVESINKSLRIKTEQV